VSVAAALEPDRQIAAKGDAYFAVAGKRDIGQGAAFTPPYTYQLDPVEGIPCAVTQRAGPR
jgi:pectate lyase